MTRPQNSAITCAYALLASLFTAVAVAAEPATTQAVDDLQQMQACWDDLQKSEPWASRALLDLYEKPDRTVAFLRSHLRPLKIEQKDLEDAMQALNSDDERIWKPAFEKLTYFDPRLNVGLETLMQNAEDPLGRNRLIEVLCDAAPDSMKSKSISLRSSGNGDFNFRSSGASWWAESRVSRLDSDRGWTQKKQWVRADRAIVLLQHIGTPEALAILKDMAGGHPEALPTKVAKVAVKSLTDKDK